MVKKKEFRDFAFLRSPYSVDRYAFLIPLGKYVFEKKKKNFQISAFAGWSPLHTAAQNGSIEIVKLIFDRDRSPDPLSDTKATPLCLACKFNSTDVGEPQLLKALLSQDCCTEKLSSSFSIFVLRGKERGRAKKAPRNSNSTYSATFFLEKRADINHVNANGATPLIYAIEGNKLENVKLLLNCGADVKKAKKDGKAFRALFVFPRDFAPI